MYRKHLLKQKEINYTKTKQETAKNTKLMKTNSSAFVMNCKCGTKKAACKNKGVDGIENGRFHCLRAQCILGEVWLTRVL